MKKIKIFAASDRNNYGDLLFPLVIQKIVLKERIHCEIENFGIIKSDLSAFGALPTQSYRQLIQSVKRDKGEEMQIIIAGGEVLGGRWLNILRYISEFWNRINSNKLLRRIVNRSGFIENYYYRFYKSSRPFILDHPFFSKAAIAYNSVGALAAGGILNIKRYYKYFEQVGVLSVRDNYSLSNFSSVGLKARLIPDSALIMSDLFTEELQQLVSDPVKEIGMSPYVFVQLGHSKGPDDLELFAGELETFSRKTGLRVVLCPIGLAMDHNDQKILSKLKSLIPSFIYYDPQNIYEIMFLLAHSKMYLGTSLHGIITAQSFGVPSIAFTEKIPKLKYYIQTWLADPDNIVCGFTDFDKVNRRLAVYDSVLSAKKLEQQKQLVYRNLNEIIYG